MRVIAADLADSAPSVVPTRILRARQILPMIGPPIDNGAVVISGERIVAAGPWPEISANHAGVVLDLGEQTVLPGLVNAHCHLDFTMMRRAIQPQRSFTEWIRRINALKRSLDQADYLAGIARGFADAKKWGTTTVANIESFPELLLQLPPPPLRTWWFLEMIDVRHRDTDEQTVAGALAFFENLPGWLGGCGLSPHAPYTASGSLFEITGRAAAQLGMVVTTHVAESREEWEMFRHGRGELHDFMRQLGRWGFDCEQGRTPLAHVAAHAELDGRWILAHMNELDASDFALLAAMPRGRRPSVVHCPGSHRYFRHGPFPMAKLLELGFNVCLGTDSLASTDSLSLFAEMRVLHEREPWLGAEQILKMATRNGAKALGFEGGKIAAGALADLIAVPHAGSSHDVYDAVLAHREPVTWMMLNGQLLP